MDIDPDIKSDIQDATSENTGVDPSTGQVDVSNIYQNDTLQGIALPQYHQWSIHGNNYYPIFQSAKKVPAGFYNIERDNNGSLYLAHNNIVGLDDIVEFEDSVINTVMNDIDVFFKREPVYKKLKIPHKRGILLYGPPGGGKSCTIKMASKRLLKKDGIVINWDCQPSWFVLMANYIRSIEPNRPIIVILEDIDALIQMYNESSILNVLDGVASVEHVMFIATTNYPEQLEQRVCNRPGRFDRRVLVPLPTESMRRTFFTPYLEKVDSIELLPKWVRDTESFTFAHMKELFKSVFINGWDYDKTLEEINSMFDKVESSDNFEGKSVGFGKAPKHKAKIGF